MDRDAQRILKSIWKHSGTKGNVWLPHISEIANGKGGYFREGQPLPSDMSELPDISHTDDWYFTPAVAHTPTRKKGSYGVQKVLWVDCDDNYNDVLLTALKPTFVWETSPGHKQAVWLMRDDLPPHDFDKNGFVGMVTYVLNADPSGWDIGQLLRVPGSTHNKGEPFKGNILVSKGPITTKGSILTRVARGLGFKPGISAQLGADYSKDRSKLVWSAARSAAELGLEQEVIFKILNQTSWNKWKDEPERLREDISKAYALGSTPQEPTRTLATPPEELQEEVEEYKPLVLETPGVFSKVLKTPLKWVLPGIIPESGCGIIVSAPKVGKTRVSMEMALGIASGILPMGKSVRKARNVGFFSLEDGAHLFAERLQEYISNDDLRNQYHWDGFLDTDFKWYPPKPLPLHVGFTPIDLNKEIDHIRLEEVINLLNLEFVIIDTLSMAMGNADVNASKEVYGILSGLKAIAKRTGCAIMLIHHTRKRVFDKGETIQEMILGSTAIHAWSDFILGLTKPEDSDLLKVIIQTKRETSTKYLDENLKFTTEEVENTLETL